MLREPKAFTRFILALFRFTGLLLGAAGLLLLVIAVIGFFIMLARIGPTIVSSIQQLDQQMAGFIFLVSLGSLLIFPIIGLVGLGMAGIGLVLRLVGTERRVNSNNHQGGQMTDEPAGEPPTKGAG